MKKKNIITTLKDFIHNEGVSYTKIGDDYEFKFDYDSDEESDIIKLKKMSLEPIDMYENTYYYGYEFGNDISSDIRTKFIKAIKFNPEFEKTDDFKKFVYNAVLNLNRTIDLPNINTIVCPQTQSNLNREIIKHIGNLTYLKNYTNFELIKNIPKNISFNFERFEQDELCRVNDKGNPVYTEHAKKQIIENIHKMLEEIRSSEYFSIARSVKKDKYRKYFENFLMFENDKEKQKYLEISNNEKDILIVDDVTTTGTTLFEMLRILRSINNRNKIIIFTLVGKKF